MVPILFSTAVSDASGAAEARRLVRSVAAEAGLPDTDVGRAAIVASEAASNIVKHGSGGDVVVRSTLVERRPVVDILAIDRGAGMANLAECLRDGYTTVGTAGNGLGAIRRQSTVFDAFSGPGKGTVILSRIAMAGQSLAPGRGLLIDGLAMRKKGEDVCGDAWTCSTEGPNATIMVADGLGHGETAADAAAEAVTAFHQGRTAAPLEVLDRVHRALVKTRGAAVAVAHVDAAAGRLVYGGVGNIAATIENGAPARHLVSLHGTAGHQVRRLQDFTYPWSNTDVLVMHSDGVSAHWTLANYPGLKLRHPLVIAAVILRDFSRGRDDATVVVARGADAH